MNRLPYVVDRHSVQHRTLIALVVVLAAAAAIWGGGLSPYPLGQLTRVLIYAIAIAGLNIATGYMGLLSVGHSAFFGLGAFTTGILIVHGGWSGWSTIPVAFVVCLIVGLLVGLPALRIRGLYLAMVTLALGVAFPELVAHFDELTGGPSGMIIRRTDLRPPAWTGLGLGQKDVWAYWLAVILLAIVLYVTARLVHSRYGLAMTAVRQDEIAASAYGINVAVVKTAMFGLSGAMTGVAGSVFALYLGSLFAEGSFTVLAAISLVIGLVIGGERTVLGPLLGAVVIIYVPEITADIGQGQASPVLFATALIAVTFLAPAGIVGGLTRVGRRFMVLRSAPPANGVAGGSVPAPEHVSEQDSNAVSGVTQQQ